MRDRSQIMAQERQEATHFSTTSDRLILEVLLDIRDKLDLMVKLA